MTSHLHWKILIHTFLIRFYLFLFVCLFVSQCVVENFSASSCDYLFCFVLFENRKQCRYFCSLLHLIFHSTFFIYLNNKSSFPFCLILHFNIIGTVHSQHILNSPYHVVLVLRLTAVQERVEKGVATSGRATSGRAIHRMRQI